MWIVKLLAAVEKIKAIASAISTIADEHPELKARLVAAFDGVLNALQNRDSSAIFALVDEVKSAFTAFTAAYTAETASGALADLLAKLKSIAA